MQVVVREINIEDSKDELMRLNALAAISVLVDLLSNEDYADVATITNDYRGDTFTPITFIEMVKFVPRWSPSNIQLESIRLDMREWFGEDHVDHDILRQIVYDLGEAMNELVAKGPPPLIVARSI